MQCLAPTFAVVPYHIFSTNFQHSGYPRGRNYDKEREVGVKSLNGLELPQCPLEQFVNHLPNRIETRIVDEWRGGPFWSSCLKVLPSKLSEYFYTRISEANFIEASRSYLRFSPNAVNTLRYTFFPVFGIIFVTLLMLVLLISTKFQTKKGVCEILNLTRSFAGFELSS